MNTKATRYCVRGSVRGTISANHRTLSGALRSELRDAAQCRACGGGAYSDASVRREDGEPLTEDELDRLDALRGF